ncbi:efflux RND transporter permease subunit [Radicibacter daui]|uniref:efflux RND transporter permease subunit n=1 Tax=Radicibacter daui TaxID=3064829 RepID=UPI0040469A8A
MSFNISAWAIRRPLPSVLLFIVLTIAGLYGFYRLPVSYFPPIITPTVNITVEQTGARPAELETEVTRPVEDAISSLPAIKSLESTIDQGRSVTKVELELGMVTPDRAIADVRDQMAKIRSSLPDTIDEPVIERVEEEPQAVVTYALAAPDMTRTGLSWFVDDVVARKLQGLPGVGRVERVGGADREIQVALDAARLQSLALTADDVNRRLLQTQLRVSGGRSSLGGREQALTTQGAALTVQDLADARLALSGDSSVRLGDIATVSDTGAEARAFAALDGDDVVGFSVYRSQGASEVAVADAVATVVTGLAHDNPGIRFSLAEDNVSYTKGNYASALHTLLEGAVLSVIVVFLFLRDWRATVVAGIALPLSIIPTFFALDFIGFSLNILSLLAITLVTGILVDDSIVEIENIVRHRNMGKSAFRAALDASDEIGLAVIAISATIIAVFVPVGTMSGVIGLYFREFGLTVAIAVFFSLLVARLITPVLAAWFMSGKEQAHRPAGRLMLAYENMLRLGLRWRWLTVSLALGLFVFAMAGLLSLPTAFLPDEDQGRLMLSVELPPGASLDETRATTGAITAIALWQPGVSTVFTRAGANANGRKDVRFATVLVNLAHKSQRSLSSRQIEAGIERQIARLPDARLTFLNNRGGRDISFAVMGTDGEAVQHAAGQILDEMSADPDFISPVAGNTAMRPELKMEIRSDKAALLGITPEAIARALRVSTVGELDSQLPNFLEGSRQIPIRVLIGQQDRDRLTTLQLLPIPSPGGGPAIPLSAVADIYFDEAVSSIERLDRERRVEIGANMGGALTSGQGLERVYQLASVRNLPAGVHIQATGDSDNEGDVFSSFIVAMGSGLMFVLVVLILLFGSFLTPWTILASLPLSVGGVTAALLLSGSAISLPVVIGILMLMGIVTKNAIMLLDFALLREAEGLSRTDAIIEACLQRIRPIIMTTLAMVAGMLPSAFGIGDGGEFRAPMAIAVIGGLLASTVLSLIVIPALHLIVANGGDRIARGFRLLVRPAEI